MKLKRKVKVADLTKKQFDKYFKDTLANMAKEMAEMPLPKNRASTKKQKWEIILRLYRLWAAHGDMRLSQLIGTVYPCGPMPTDIDMRAAIGGHYKLPEHRDSYHVEDSDFIKELEQAFDRMDKHHE